MTGCWTLLERSKRGEGTMHRVLFIDDEPDAAEDFSFLLRPYGLEVVAKQSIEEALVLFRKERYDAVLVDICMPPTAYMSGAVVEHGRETGLEVARRLKKLKPNVPIVAFTVVSDPEIMGRMRQAGICDVIHKPSLAEAVAEALQNAVLRARRRT